MIGRKKILVAPLDWGLGHATRCVPIIRKLEKEGHEVILAANGGAWNFLRLEFPDLELIEIKGYGIRYSKNISVPFFIFLQIPKVIWRIFNEHQWLRKFVRERKIDEIISDNRYGLWNDKIHSTFITHQLMIKCPAPFKFMEKIFSLGIRWFIKKYDECWIPDIAGDDNISGDLSHKYPIPANCKFIGWLSRFDISVNHENPGVKYDLCVLLSGPEPQRTILEEKIYSELTNTHIRAILVQGKPGINNNKFPREGFRFVSHLDDEELKSVLQNSELIICRAGYTTIMDLKILGKKAVLIPTPGQTEQEYLAEYLSGKENFSFIQEDLFSLKQLISSMSIAEKSNSVLINPVVATY